MAASRVRPAFCFGLAAALLSAAGCSPRFDWRELREPALGFSVALPEKPQRVTRTIEVPAAGQSVALELTVLSTGVGPTLFAAGVARLPAADRSEAALTAALVASLRDGLLRNVGAAQPHAEAAPPPPGLNRHTLRAALGFSANGTAGRDRRPARLVARLYVVDDRFFELITIGADADLPPEAREMFFDSFRLLEFRSAAAEGPGRSP
jgi:hypothetical protein